MKEGLLGGKLRLSSRTNREEARLDVARWARAPGRRGEWSQAGRYLPVRSPCLHTGQQQGRRRPSSSSCRVRRMRRSLG